MSWRASGFITWASAKSPSSRVQRSSARSVATNSWLAPAAALGSGRGRRLSEQPACASVRGAKGRRLAAGAVIASHLIGCSTQAYVCRTQSDAVEGRITSSDVNSVGVQLGDGRITSVPRSHIQSIDHPGNVLAVAGLCVLLMGLEIIATEPQDNDSLAVTGAIVGRPGLTMLAWGGVNYMRSKQAAASFENEGVRLRTPAPNRPYLPAPTWDSTPLQQNEGH